MRQDLEILIEAGDDDLKGDELGRKYNLPYFNVTQTIFSGLRGLLDDQVEPARRPAALVRLRKYTGMAPGTTPLTRLAEDLHPLEAEERQVARPLQGRIERDLANNQTVVAGIGELFKKYGIAGYEEPYAKLKEQLAAYDDSCARRSSPRPHRLPPAAGALRLPPPAGGDRHAGRGAGAARRGGLQGDPERDGDPGAAGGASEKGLAVTDYRGVIRELKKQQITGDAILPLYQERIKALEEIIRREGIVSLPDRPMKFRLASEAESVAQPRARTCSRRG